MSESVEAPAIEKAKFGQHMGVCDLADILRLIAISPMTAMQVGDLHKCGVRMLRPTLRAMVQLGVAHISGWDRSKPGTPAAIYSAGRGINAKHPPNRQGKPSKSYLGVGAKIKPKATMILFANLVHCMDEGATIAEMVEQTGAIEGTVVRFANHAKRIGLAHVGAWVRSSFGYPARVFMLGARRSVPKPKGLSPEERWRRDYAARVAKQKQAAITRALVPVRELEAA